MTHFSPLTSMLLVALIATVQESHAQPASCCQKYSPRPIPCHRLRGYTIQTLVSMCDIDAVIFHTVGGRILCADPKQEWTSKRIHCLSKKVKNMKTSFNVI